MKKQQNIEEILKLAEGGGNDATLLLYDKLNELEDKFDTTVEEIKANSPDLNKVLESVKGQKGEMGETGEQGIQGENGIDGVDGQNGKDGKNGKDGRDGRDGRDGSDGKDGTDGQNGENGKDGSPDTPDEVVDKVNKSRKQIGPSQIKGLKDIENMAKANAVPVTTNFFNGLRAKNLNIIGATATQSGDTVNLTIPPSAGNAGFQVPLTGDLSGTNTWAVAPSVIVVDGVSKQKTQTDGTINWTGTTTTVLAVQPNFDIYSTS